MKLNILSIALLAGFSFIWQKDASCQKPAIKFGKIDPLELEMKFYDRDSNAHAVILGDYGRTIFFYFDTKVTSQTEHQAKGFQIIFSHYFRIKIFDNNAFQWADVEIPLYHTASGKEVVSKLNAVTYNLEGGDIKKSKLTKDMIFTEEIDKNWEKMKFSMPDIKEGSIFEVEYSITSDFVGNLPDWKFQFSIPVVRSQYEVIIPEYYNYNQTHKGYFPIQTEKRSQGNKITLTYVQKAEGISVKEATYTEDINYMEDIYLFTAENIEAFPSEQYITTIDNYNAEIEFELASRKFPNQPVESYSNTWETINRVLLEDEDFGLQLTRTGFLKDDAAELSSKYPDKLVRMQAVFDFIKQKVKWNERNGKYTSAPLNRIYQNGSGNAADINLLLVCMLNESGIKAAPVVLSTRNNGIIHPAHASLNRINYVVATAIVDADTFLLDATEPYSIINLLPPRCLNGDGRLVDDKSGRWIELQGNTSKIQKSYELVLDQEGNFTGKNSNKRTDYYGYNFRKDVKSYSDESEYIKKIQEENPNLKITEWTIRNLDSLHLPVLDEYQCIITSHCEKAGDLMLFSPMFFEATGENPFKLEERKYPVEINYPSTEQHLIQIKIPDGYRIESIPTSVRISLSDNAASFTYNLVNLQDRIMCSSKLDINKTLFLPEEYAELKLFFNTFIAKQAEQVVLKKM
jgi:hypothetical protein